VHLHFLRLPWVYKHECLVTLKDHVVNHAMTAVFIGSLLITFVQLIHMALSDTVEHSDTHGGMVRDDEHENSHLMKSNRMDWRPSTLTTQR
jgi:hypothetical protein